MATDDKRLIRNDEHAEKVRRIVEVMETFRLRRTLSFIERKLGEPLAPSKEEEAEAIIAELSR